VEEDTMLFDVFTFDARFVALLLIAALFVMRLK
jgi:hypothetical protein